MLRVRVVPTSATGTRRPLGRGMGYRLYTHGIASLYAFIRVSLPRIEYDLSMHAF